MHHSRVDGKLSGFDGSPFSVGTITLIPITPPSPADGDETTIQLQQLLDLLVQGDNVQSVKTLLMERAHARLRQIARRMLLGYNRNELDEETDALVAEAYLSLNRSLDDLRPETVRQFFGLTALHMRRHLLDKLRMIHGRGRDPRPRAVSLNNNPDSSGPQHDPVAASDVPWKSIDVLEALEMLDERERECLTLQHWFGLTHAEISQLLNVSTKTVQRSCNLALIKLTKLLKDYQ